MKRLLLTPSLLLLSGFLAFGQTAVNFTANDCTGASHTLFTELDAGKVIVICWVMPCPICITGAITSADTVKSYATSNPGRVKFYLVDDVGNTSCSALISWADSNNIKPDATFGNVDTLIKMSDYGFDAMPKTVVLGGTSHTVFYNSTDDTSETTLKTAIDKALTATGIIEKNNISMGLSIFPNPVVNEARINYTLSKATDVSVDVLNLLGEKITAVSIGKQISGKQECRVNLASIGKGVYFVKLNVDGATETTKMFVTH